MQLLQGATGSTVADSQATTSEGCAFFPFLPDGSTYRLKVAKAGYVDLAGVSEPVSSATLVTTGAVTSIPCIYDRAVRSSRRSPTKTAYMPTPLILAGEQPHQPAAAAGGGHGHEHVLQRQSSRSPTATRVAGWCRNRSDAYLDEPTDPSLRAPLIPVTSGGTSATALSVPTLDVLVRRSNGTARTSQAITLYYAGSDPSCTPPNVTYGGVTDGSGRITVAIPYGTWQVRANGRTASGGWPTIEVTPQNSIPSQAVTVVTT